MKRTSDNRTMTKKYVFLFDGPIGVGKSSLGREVARRLNFGFIDGDDYSEPGPWLHSILKTSKKILFAGNHELEKFRCIIISYPLRYTNWFFYKKNFEKSGVDCRCIGLLADINNIRNRARKLSESEIQRSMVMLKQGYGSRMFSDMIVRTDKSGFEQTCQELMNALTEIVSNND